MATKLNLYESFSTHSNMNVGLVWVSMFTLMHEKVQNYHYCFFGIVENGGRRLHYER